MLRNWGQLNRMNKRHRENYCPPRYDACGVVWCMLRRVRETCCLHRRIHHPFIRDSILLWNLLCTYQDAGQHFPVESRLLSYCCEKLNSQARTFLAATSYVTGELISFCVVCSSFFLTFPEVMPSNLWRDICYPYLNNPLSFFPSLHVLKCTTTASFHIQCGYARTNVIGSRTSFLITSVRSGTHRNICI